MRTGDAKAFGRLEKALPLAGRLLVQGKLARRGGEESARLAAIGLALDMVEEAARGVKADVGEMQRSIDARLVKLDGALESLARVMAKNRAVLEMVK